MTLLPLVFLLLAPAQTDRERCESIKTTRQLAAQDGLPVSPTLIALEQRYCAAPPTSAAPETAAPESAA